LNHLLIHDPVGHRSKWTNNSITNTILNFQITGEIDLLMNRLVNQTALCDVK
jgi:hypothetical protein